MSGEGIEEIAEPGPEVRAEILSPLLAFNAANGFPPDAKTVALVKRDGSGALVGGLYGRTGYDWLFVEFLVVDEAARGTGLGTALMRRAEDIAKARGCVGAWLTTFPFQARGFYEKLGFELFAELPQSPGENVRQFMRKRY